MLNVRHSIAALLAAFGTAAAAGAQQAGLQRVIVVMKRGQVYGDSAPVSRRSAAEAAAREGRVE